MESNLKDLKVEMILKEFENQIDEGKIGPELFARMTEAEAYGTAPSMRWLGGVFLKLDARSKKGEKIEVYSLGKKITLSSHEQFLEFCQGQFRDAFVAFFQNRILKQRATQS